MISFPSIQFSAQQIIKFISLIGLIYEFVKFMDFNVKIWSTIHLLYSSNDNNFEYK